MTDRITGPHVYRAISRITREFATNGIAKTHVNLIDQYQYRSVDDVLNRLAPLLPRHRLCILPRVLSRDEQAVRSDFDTELASVRLDVEFDLVSARDGSRHTIRAWGEALDASDKGTAKAMSAAFKAAMIQTFCIPVGNEDTDRVAHRRRICVSNPKEGWECWCTTLKGDISACDSGDKLTQLRSEQASLLQSLQRERPDLYADLGEVFTCRLAELNKQRSCAAASSSDRLDA